MVAPEPTFAQMALDHLKMVDEDSGIPELRMHCHFAKLFLQLALEGGGELAVAPVEIGAAGDGFGPLGTSATHSSATQTPADPTLRAPGAVCRSELCGRSRPDLNRGTLSRHYNSRPAATRSYPPGRIKRRPTPRDRPKV